MKLSLLILAAALLTPALFADDHNTDFDPQTDFSSLKTFTIREGQLATQKLELTGPLVRKRIEDSIRTQLTAKGLKEVQAQPDVVVTFRLGAADKKEVDRFPVGRFGRGVRKETIRYTEGTLVINLLERTGRDLVWRGIYRDDESNAAKLSSKLGDDIKKLFSDYPPKKK